MPTTAVRPSKLLPHCSAPRSWAPKQWWGCRCTDSPRTASPDRGKLDDLNSRLTFTLIERPESSGEHLELRDFSGEADRDLFGARTADIGAAGDGSGGRAGSLDDEIGSALGRINAEDAVWLVAEIGTQTVGMVFGELVGGEVNVRIWIHPDQRKHGYGTAALRKARSEMARYFPAVPMVVRAPGAAAG